MVYHFKITSPESKNFLIEMGIDGEHTFFDFHIFIQKCTGYEPYQLASFFISDQYGKKQREISMLNTGVPGGAYLVMQKTRLAEVIRPNIQHLVYLFDFINDRSLNLQLTGIIMERKLNEPFINLNQGDAPVQVYEDESYVPEPTGLQEEEVVMDFGILNDYTELYGEMEDY